MPAACTPSSLVTRSRAIGSRKCYQSEEDGARDEHPRTVPTRDGEIWSGREDLNLRPPDPQSGALPGCATPRQERRLSQIYATPSRTEARAQSEQALTHAHERLRVGGFAHAELELLPPLAGFRGQTLLGALERQPLIVEKALDTLHELEIAPAVQSLAGGILLGA